MKSMKEQEHRAAALILVGSIIFITLSLLLIAQGCSPNPPAPTCTVTTIDTGVTITCPDGTTATILNGTNGKPGVNGIDGSNATITVVQLCQGFTPTYPNVFPESALCINNQLWGVYSANGGFGVLMPPGQYSSTGVNASCNLVVGSNCEVTVN